MSEGHTLAKGELLEALRASRDEVLQIVRSIPPERLEDGRYENGWNGRQILAHVAAQIVPIPAANIFPIPTIGGTPEAAASAYEETLTAAFGAELPRFDLILLGIGPDGHTASLFPGQPEVVRPSAALAVAVHNAPKPPPVRITCTYTLINAAANVLFVVAGADKAGALRAVLRDPADVARLPAQGVRPKQGALVWLVDAAVAKELV